MYDLISGSFPGRNIGTRMSRTESLLAGLSRITNTMNMLASLATRTAFCTVYRKKTEQRVNATSTPPRDALILWTK